MFKKLLYLYHDGHNPFPTGRGGLGYHLPQYPKVIHGEGRTHRDLEDSDEEDIEQPEIDIEEEYEDIEQPEIDDKDVIIIKNADPSTPEGRKVIVEQYKKEVKQLIKETEDKKIEKIKKIDVEGIIREAIDKVDKVPKKHTPPPPPPPHPSVTIQNEIKEEIPQVKEKKKTQKEIKAEIKAEHDKIKLAIENKLYEKRIKGHKQVSTSILENFPNLTFDEFKNNTDKYIEMYYNNKFEKIEKMEAIKKAVTEEHGQGDTDTKGHAAEIVLLRDYQNDIKELTDSTDPDDIISLSSESDGFKNDDGVVPTIRWFNPNTKQYEDKDISHFSLFDADGKNASIDLKYYKTEDVDVQFTKIYGNPGNFAFYREIDGNIKLYNVANKTTKKLINKFNDTDTYIVAKTPSTLASWQINKFIQKNINKQTEVINTKYNDIDCFIIKPSFIDRMIKEGKVKKGKTHKEYGWFSVNTKKMIKK